MRTELQKMPGKGTLWLGAALFAIAFEAGSLLISWGLLGGPQSMDSIASFKVTANVGIPGLQSLLEAAHQPSTNNAIFAGKGFMALLVLISSMFIYGLGNAYYLALLARSQRDLPGTSGQDARRSFGKILLWMFTQALFMGIMVPIIGVFGVFGGLLAIVLMLWFRYHFLFFEFTVVVEQTGFKAAFRRSVELRNKVKGKALTYFLLIAGVNTVLAFLLNAFFSVGTLALMLPLNAILLTAIQNGLLQVFFDARDQESLY
ncbi:hypothetical protein CBW65_09795 [Tumebacillus avium]|uniref:Glycerophosphoryl diester phosphodiesterase membrane domain-containing protein n=1 Tax=Tumebacillus avium TaxID=1903704 RepID=A0A1Y0IPH2_9BACL|nr:hypothetical protein [Tumebacillus avium]ARU61253.1 hypothetical protein CBW65_09795 [Tumebacillus avium]